MFVSISTPSTLKLFVSLSTVAMLAAATPMCVFAANDTPTVATQIAEAGGTAPEFIGLKNWFNSSPVRMADLRGKVVLVDFWTYNCVNCVRTLPYVTKLQEKYRDKGLVIVGIHTPEFPFEKSAANVQAAIRQHRITYAVAQDNDSATWNAYHNRYWPAQYIVDQRGKIVFQHDGEGQYDRIEQTIQKLLNGTS